MLSSEPCKVWRAPLVDEGWTTAVYPYAQLREIQAPEDCRSAVLDETQELEQEFGLSTVKPVYELLWVLNVGAGVVTSHTVVAPPHHQPPYAWAKTYVATAIIVLSRDPRDHQERQPCDLLVNELGRLISTTAPNEDFLGWHLSVGPCHVIFQSEMILTNFHTPLQTDVKGFGCQLIIGGAANARSAAAARWRQAVLFVTNALRRHQEGMMPAPPHRHAPPGVLQTSYQE